MRQVSWWRISMSRENWPRRAILGLPVSFMLRHPLVARARAQNPTLQQLPPNLPVPKDDGAARHLTGMALPDLALPSTANRQVNLSKITAARLVVYCYPRTGEPDKPVPAGWDDIPGA